MRLWTAEDVAEALRLPSARHFLARRRRLEAEHGFPQPVPGLPGRWDPQAIALWLRAYRTHHEDDAQAEVEAELIGRARALGRLTRKQVQEQLWRQRREQE
jgi:hypothetical protein